MFFGEYGGRTPNEQSFRIRTDNDDGNVSMCYMDIQVHQKTEVNNIYLILYPINPFPPL